MWIFVDEDKQDTGTPTYQMSLQCGQGKLVLVLAEIIFAYNYM